MWGGTAFVKKSLKVSAITTTTTTANNNTRFVERHGAIASEALADRSSQLARNRREKMSF